MHSHELAHFCLVVSGHYHERIGTCDFERRPNSLVYYPPDVSHAEGHLTAGRHFLIEVGNPELSRVREYGARLDAPTKLDHGKSNWLATRLYREFSERDKFSKLVLESMATELLVEVSRHASTTLESGPPRWLKRVKEYLRDNLSAPLGLHQLASVAGVHPTHLARVFRQFEKCTPGEFVRRRRVEKAIESMNNLTTPLSQIALENGFPINPISHGHSKSKPASHPPDIGKESSDANCEVSPQGLARNETGITDPCLQEERISTK